MIKKLFRYVIILLLLLLGLCAIGMLFLFFVPNSSIFGITYIGSQTTKQSLDYDISKIKTIEINSNSFRVDVVNTETSDKISVNVYSDTFGYVLKKNSEINLAEKLYGNKLTITITEPHGFAYKNNSNIQIRLPKAKNSLNFIFNNNSSNTNIDCADSTINALNYKTTSGNLTLTSGTINGAINLNMQRGDCYIDSSIKLSDNNITLNQTRGNFSTSDATVLGNFIHQSNTTGNVYVAACKNYLATNLATAGGHITIGKATEKVNIASSDTHINIGEVVGGTIINLSKSGSVNITTLAQNTEENNTATINTVSGNITVGTSYKYLNLSTKDGNIDIQKMYIAIDAETENGNINVKYADDAGSFLDEIAASANRKAVLETKNGNVTVSGVDNINLKITGQGNATIIMHEVYGNNSINATNGLVKVTTPSNLNITDDNLRHKYNLKASSEVDGNVCIAVSGVTPNYFCKTWGYKDIPAENNGNIGLTSSQTEADLKGNLVVTVTTGEIEVINVEYEDMVKQQKAAR